MEADGAAAGLEALELKDSCDEEGKMKRNEDGARVAEFEERLEVVASKSKKKKKKKKANSHAPDCIREPFQLLPSQELVGSLFPWKAVVRPRRGRCAIATRDIKAGEVVVVEQAVAFIPRSQDRTSVCHECCRDLHQNASPVECPGCKHVIFCQACEASAILVTEHGASSYRRSMKWLSWPIVMRISCGS